MIRATVMAAACAGLMATGPAVAQEQLPERLANDPVAKALGAKIINAALKEGKVTWYGATTSEDFLTNGGGKERFEKRFGIKLEPVTGRNQNMVDRIKTEAAVGRQTADLYEGNDQYMLDLYNAGVLVPWRPPAPELDKINKEVFVREPAGYWWPVHVSAQALVINTKMVKPEEEPKSYWDIVNPKWKGKVAMRDPRSAGGGAWQMMSFYHQPGLGLDYIQKLRDTVKPFVVEGGSRVIRDVVARGQFAIALNGRGEFIHDLPPGVPVKFVVPKEGMAWTPSSMALIKNSPNPNAAKVLMTWFYDMENLQKWTEFGRPVPHPAMKVPIPEMSVSDYPLMTQLPTKWLAEPNFFFELMEKTFGIR